MPKVTPIGLVLKLHLLYPSEEFHIYHLPSIITFIPSHWLCSCRLFEWNLTGF